MKPPIPASERQSEALRLRQKCLRAEPSVGRSACRVCAMPPLIRISLLVASRLQQGVRYGIRIGLSRCEGTAFRDGVVERPGQAAGAAIETLVPPGMCDRTGLGRGGRAG